MGQPVSMPQPLETANSGLISALASELSRGSPDRATAVVRGAMGSRTRSRKRLPSLMTRRQTTKPVSMGRLSMALTGEENSS